MYNHDHGLSGISEAAMDKLMIDIIDYATKANGIVNNISDLVDGTVSYFDCESGAEFRKQFDYIRKNSTVLNKNILSYNTDLLTVKSDYTRRETEFVEGLVEATVTVNSKNNIEGGKV
jgi:hypothetical protein